MGQNAIDQLDSKVAGAIASLHTLFDTEPDTSDAGDILAGIEDKCTTMGGELLFELPADHPNLGESTWTVLRFWSGGEERFLHVFFGGGDHAYWIGEDGEAPAEFANFAHAWTSLLTHCAAGLDMAGGELRAVS